jgi:hypothetical protein
MVSMTLSGDAVSSEGDYNADGWSLGHMTGASGGVADGNSHGTSDIASKTLLGTDEILGAAGISRLPKGSGKMDVPLPRSLALTLTSPQVKTTPLAKQASSFQCYRSTAFICGWLPALLFLLAVSTTGLSAGTYTMVGWSEQGLHETDGADVSVYSMLPPYSTIHAQFISGGLLVRSTNGITVTYEAVADGTGSINSTSRGKGNFYQYVQALYGKNLAPDQGLAGFGMPGPTNRPQAMAFDSSQNLFNALGIPLTPYDDQGRKNYAPMMRLTARNAAGAILAYTDISLPVNDEMDCRACHASGSRPDARPAEGWVWDCDPARDTKLNVLRFHDTVQGGTPDYTSALAVAGYNPAGLYATVTRDTKPILCARCHKSNAIDVPGIATVRPLTQSMHAKHAYVIDPKSGSTLNTINSSAACFQCHAGSERQYVRGVHHNTIGVDGTAAMQCQSCHGQLGDLGVASRRGWLDEPNCQSCHTGTATNSSGQFRYTSVFSAPGLVRQALDLTFAIPTNTGAGGTTLYRLAAGHGGLQCAVCHGSAHAELGSTQTNDNVQSQRLQGHPGTLVECVACHPTTPSSATGGPHYLHPVGATWVSGHQRDGLGIKACQACHGSDYHGSLLGAMQASRSLEGGRSTQFWQGAQIGCYNCHAGPGGGDDGGGVRYAPAIANNASAATPAGSSIDIALAAADPNSNPLAYRIISQPAHGNVSLSGATATYFPDPGFVGSDAFTYSAWNGYTESNLGQVAVTANPGGCVLTVNAAAPLAALPGSTAPFFGAAMLMNCNGAVSYDWDFGDGSPHSTGTNACHVYSAPNDYTWTLTTTANGLTQSVSNIVTISPTLGLVVSVSIAPADPYSVMVSWPQDRIPVSLETSYDLGQPNSWQAITDPPTPVSTNLTLQVYTDPGLQYFRLRRVP